MTDVLDRLRERKIAQWALAYLAGAWVALQVVVVLADQFGWPGWIERSITAALVVGLLVTLVLAWYHGEQGRQRVTGPELLILASLFAVGGLLLALMGPGGDGGPRGAGESAPPEAVDLVDSVTTMDSLDPHRVAVLPFDNRSPDPDDAYFTDGIHDDLLSELGKVSALSVVSRTSVERYAGAEKTVPEIARELGVGTVLEGGVQRSGDRVRINVQLIDARADEHVWSETYEEVLSPRNLFEIQSRIVGRVAEEVEATLLPEERARIGRVPTTSQRAYDLYARAKQIWLMQTRSHLERALRLLREAVALDSGFAAAYAAMSDVNADLSRYAPGQPRMDRAKELARRALELDPDLAEAHDALSYVLHFYEWDVEGARRHALRATELNPSYMPAHWSLGMARLNMGEWTRGLEELRRAWELDPVTPWVAATYAWGLRLSGRPDDALRVLDETLALHPGGDPAGQLRGTRAVTLLEVGRREQAVREARRALRQAEAGGDPSARLSAHLELASVLAEAGRGEEARTTLREAIDGAEARGDWVSPVDVAWVHIALEQPDSAFAWLDRAVEQRDQELVGVSINLRAERGDPIRADPRYADLMRRIGFDPAEARAR